MSAAITLPFFDADREQLLSDMAAMRGGQLAADIGRPLMGAHKTLLEQKRVAATWLRLERAIGGSNDSKV